MDETLRELARRAQQDPALRPQLLVARLRAGELAQDRLELAAYVGDADARAALGPSVRRWTTGRVCCCGSDERDGEHGTYGVESYTHGFVHACDYYGTPCECTVEEHVEQRPREWPGDRSFRSFCDGVTRFAADAIIRATFAAAWTALPAWCDSTRMSGRRGMHDQRLAEEGSCRRCTRGDFDDPREGDALAALSAFLGCMCGACVGVLGRYLPAIDDRQTAWWGAPILAATSHRGQRALDRWVIEGLEQAARLATEQRVRAAVRDALAAWALGDA